MSRLATSRVIAVVVLFGATAALAGIDASFVDLPTLTMDPFGTAPLSAKIDFTTDVDAQATLRVSDGIEEWSVKFPDLATTHSLPLFGLKSGRTYSVEVTLTPGGATDSSLTATTPPLPADFPAVELLHYDHALMEPGYTLLDGINHGRGDPRPRYVTIVDKWGDVVWYTPLPANSIEQLPNGNLFYRCGQQACELDLYGNRTPLVTLADPGNGLHHDLFTTVDGTYLSLSRDPVEIVDYPSSEEDPDAPPATATIRDEPIVEFAADGSLLNEWTLLDMIDPLRIGYDSLFSTPDGLDWIHTNSVFHYPADDSILVSARHQDAVVKFSRETGELIWILGPHENWTATYQPFLLTPVGAPFNWQFHQHAAMMTPDDTLLLFDNGNYRASPFDGTIPYDTLTPTDNYSGAIEYRIDEETMEIEMLWEYGSAADEIIYASFVGDVDWLPETENVLLTYGGTRVMDGVINSDAGYGTVTTRIVEVTHETPATKVFDLFVWDPEEVQAITYRSERLPSLYAPEVMVTDLGVVGVGAVPNGGSIPGTPLTIVKGVEGALTMAWGKSCVSSDIDYAIYEGTLGDWESHDPAVCSTGGSLSQTIAPEEGNRFFLVVPMNGSEEGSYGTDSGDADRAASDEACLPQAPATCPQ